MFSVMRAAKVVFVLGVSDGCVTARITLNVQPDILLKMQTQIMPRATADFCAQSYFD